MFSGQEWEKPKTASIKVSDETLLHPIYLLTYYIYVAAHLV